MPSSSSIRPLDLRCEYRKNPRGIQETVPRLSWMLEPVNPDERGLSQSAYQVQVASSLKGLKSKPDLWDSECVNSGETFQIEYKGKILTSRMDCFWRVRVWDQNNKPSPWSDTAYWSMGLLDPQDWKAKWIEEPDPVNFEGCRWMWHPEDREAVRKAKVATACFQKNISIPEDVPIANAVLHIAADDWFDLYVNGMPAARSESLVDDYKTAQTVDIAPGMCSGENLISIAVTNDGKGNPAGVAGRISIRLENGSQFAVSIDSEWKVDWIPEKQEEIHRKFHNDWANAAPLCVMGEVDAFNNPTQPWGVPGRKDNLILSPVPMFRKKFILKNVPEKAVVFASALGIYSLYVNGQKVADDFFTPGWSDYFERVHYNTYDLKPFLKKGENVIGAILADGWHSGYVGWGRIRNRYKGDPNLLLQLHLDYKDGSSGIIATDNTWRTSSNGPWLEADLLMGETYDARKEMDKWAEPDFNDEAWKYAAIGIPPEIKIDAYPGEPVGIQGELKPLALSEPKPGVFVFDLGQNMVGVVRLRAFGSKDTRIAIRHAEILNEDGTLYTTALRGARSTDAYIKRTDHEETWMPRFTFHGFRYVEVTGLPSRPSMDTITGIALHTNMETAGDFSTSNIMVNRLYQNLVWGQKGNYLEVPTDCPQRDERLGWTGDAQIFIRTGTFNYDISAFMTKWMQDLFDAQDAEGWFHVVAPKLPFDPLPRHACHAWSDAAIICPWILHKVYGDARLIRKYYDAMVKYLAHLKDTSKDLIRPAQGYGDWVSLNANTPLEVINTAYFALCARMMSEMAGVIGKEKDEEQYRILFEEIKSAFNKAFVLGGGMIRGGAQTCYVLALHFDLLPPEIRPLALAHLVKDLAYRDGHLSTGFVGLKDLLPTLSEEGRDDLAYRLLLKDDFPSWLYEIKCGATTIWERWDGWSEELKLQDAGMNSFNHYAFGAVGEWMFRFIGGIDLLEPGYKKARIKPRPGGNLRFARVHYKSISGWIESEWFQEKNELRLICRIPVNVTARVHLPCRDPKDILEGDNPIDESNSMIKFDSFANGEAVYEVLSGHYSFKTII
ncbi:family 78 glycoside hydrolase catalytic domain [Candidatus Sumerlaeota bacterium]|nr:family 78 glycoside hydrolase catalytic domain [Candidatus Sumerlaeota bacterium]